MQPVVSYYTETFYNLCPATRKFMKAMYRVMLCQNGTPETKHWIRPKMLDWDSNPECHINLYYVGFILRRWLWSLFPSGIWRHVVWLIDTDVSKDFLPRSSGKKNNSYRTKWSMIQGKEDKVRSKCEQMTSTVSIKQTIFGDTNHTRMIRVTKYCLLLSS